MEIYNLKKIIMDKYKRYWKDCEREKWRIDYILICCEVSYLYIRLLAQLWYLTNVGFLNIPPQTQDVVLTKPLSNLVTKEAQISALLGLARISAQRLGGSDFDLITWISAWLGRIIARSRLSGSKASILNVLVGI